MSGHTYSRFLRFLTVTALMIALILPAAQPAGGASPGSISIVGHGYGHGVGLSMIGVYFKALDGADYRSILQYYYTGVGWGARSDETVVEVVYPDGVRRPITVREYLWKLAEEPDSWPREGLKTLMVAARTYLWYKVDTYGYMPGGQAFNPDINPDTRPNIKAAQAETADQILIYNSRPIVAAYSSSAGGYTAGLEHVWGGSPLPYLKPVPSPEDARGAYFVWQKDVPVAAIEAAYPSIGGFTNLQVLERSGYGDWGGRAVRLRISGTLGSVDRLGDAFADAVGLRSNYFTIGRIREGFTESLGQPSSRRGFRILFPWYDQATPGMTDWLLAGNANGNQGSLAVLRDSWENLYRGSLVPRATYTGLYRGKFGGPLDVRTSVPAVASQRVHYGAGFSEVSGLPARAMSWLFVFPWYDQATPGMTNWLLVANPRGNRTTRVRVVLGATQLAWVYVPAGTTRVFQWPGRRGGPLKVHTTDGQKILASQRVHYRNTFEELMGTPSMDLAYQHTFPWYDDATPGMTDWLLVANPQLTPTDVTVKLAGVQLAGRRIAARSTAFFRLRGRINGPLEVRSTRPVTASQRVFFNGSFNEVQGLPGKLHSSHFIFPWYDQRNAGMKEDWLLIGNPAGNATARFSVRLQGAEIASGTVAGGRTWAGTFPGVLGGPLEVVTTNGVKVVVSQRVHSTSW